MVQSVRIKDMEVPAEFLYQATPKLDAQAYLMAHIMDWEELDLISGRLRIYFEDDFVGESTLGLNLASDTLSLSLGPDPCHPSAPETGRARQQDPTSSRANARLEREWEITVDNRKQQPIRIVIDDQLPLSNDEDVEVKADDLGRGKARQRHGRVEWDITVKPRNAKTSDSNTASKPHGSPHSPGQLSTCRSLPASCDAKPQKRPTIAVGLFHWNAPPGHRPLRARWASYLALYFS